MPLDTTRVERGKMNFHAGLAAETIVLSYYLNLGFECLAGRWRGKAGEIDLILRASDEIIFVEVKKSASFSTAAQRIGLRQQQRLLTAAQEFLTQMPNGSLLYTRFDAALVDQHGQLEIIENAVMAG